MEAVEYPVSLAETTFGQLSLYAPRVVGLSGYAGSGKSTAAAHLVDRGFTLVKFAGPLKDMCRAIGLTEDHIEGKLKQVPLEVLQGKSPREFMQLLGTEFGRDLIGSKFWIDLWKAQVSTILDEGGSVVTDDCRFANEAAAIRSFEGAIYRLSGRGGIEGGHSSEQHHFEPDETIPNTHTIRHLCLRLDDLIA